MDTAYNEVLEAEVIAADQAVSNIRKEILDLRAAHLAASGDGTLLVTGIEPEQFHSQMKSLLQKLEIAAAEFHAALAKWAAARG
jgi:hypothetical protein